MGWREDFMEELANEVPCRLSGMSPATEEGKGALGRRPRSM